MRRDLKQNRFYESPSSIVPIRQYPHMTGGFDRGHNEFGLSLRTIRAHCRNHTFVAVLVEPPHRSEPFDNYKIINGRFYPKAVVEKQRLAEFDDCPFSLSF